MAFELDTGGNRKPWKEIKSRDGFREMVTEADVRGRSRLREGRAGRGCVGLTRRVSHTLGTSESCPASSSGCSRGQDIRNALGRGPERWGAWQSEGRP